MLIRPPKCRDAAEASKTEITHIFKHIKPGKSNAGKTNPLKWMKNWIYLCFTNHRFSQYTSLSNFRKGNIVCWSVEAPPNSHATTGLLHDFVGATWHMIRMAELDVCIFENKAHYLYVCNPVFSSYFLSIEITKDVRCMILYWIETLIFLETTTRYIDTSTRCKSGGLLSLLTLALRNGTQFSVDGTSLAHRHRGNTLHVEPRHLPECPGHWI